MSSIRSLVLGTSLATATMPGSPRETRQAAAMTLIIATTQVSAPFQWRGAVGFRDRGAEFANFCAARCATTTTGTRSPISRNRWEVAPDGLSVTLHLVKNAVFHDGQAADIRRRRLLDHGDQGEPPVQDDAGGGEQVETPDPSPRSSAVAPCIRLPAAAMSPALMPILPKHVYGDGQDMKTHPANLEADRLGAVQAHRVQAGRLLYAGEVRRFFIPGRPKLDKIVVRSISDQNAALVALERGDGARAAFRDGGVAISSDYRRFAKPIPRPTRALPARAAELAGLQHQEEAARRRPQVRQAIAFSANRDFIISKLMGGKAMPSTGPIAPGSPLEEKTSNSTRSIRQGRHAA